jgi:hypothetical protein
MILSVAPDGITRFIYQELLPLDALGPSTIARASHVEPDASGQWWADMSPVGGPMLGPFPADRKSLALAAEVAYLEARM